MNTRPTRCVPRIRVCGQAETHSDPRPHTMATVRRRLVFVRWSVALAIGGALLGWVDYAPAADQKRVLVLYSTRIDTQFPTTGDRQFPRLMQQGLGTKPDYYPEYIDAARFPEPDYTLALDDYLKAKYAGTRLDLVIAAQKLALTFVSQHRDELFRDVPVVFISEDDSIPRMANSTGVVVARDYRRTIEFARKLQPDTTHVFVVTGSSSRDNLMQATARAQLESLAPQLTFTYLSNLTTQALEQRLSTLPERSIVYYLLFYQDADGVNLNPLEYLDRLSAVANRPIYSWIDSTMNHGIIGGSLLSIDSQIETLANLALDVLRGGLPDAIPVVTRDLSIDRVDMRQLQRWSISASRIPPGTVQMFREAGAWERYKVYILAGTAFLVLETILIASLLIQASRRRRAETRMSGSEAELRTSYDRIRDLGGRLIVAQEAERSRIARELHDDVSQEVALLTMHLNVASSAARKGRRDAETFVNEALERTHRIANTLHDISHRLHPARLRLIGLVPAINGLLRELRKSDSAIAISFMHENVPDAIDPEAALCMFRITQEALQNVIKHSGADRIEVHLVGDRTQLRMTFTDNGVGFDVRAVERRGIGLISIGERLEPFGGTLTIRSTIGTGTRLEVILPLGTPAKS